MLARRTINENARRTIGEDPAVLRRREQDAKALTIKAKEKEEFRRELVSNWQAKGAQKMEQIQIQNITRQLEAQQAEKLEVRRQHLAELLAMEEEQYRIELTTCQQSTIDKLKNTLSIARKQREEKEERRKQYAQEQYMRMWRDNCDDIRTIDSEAYLKFTKEEQYKQALEKKTKSPEQLAEEAKWQEVWESDYQAKLAREQADLQRREQLARETRDAAHSQMSERQRARDEDAEQKRLEREEWTRRVQAEQAEAERLKELIGAEKRAKARAVSAWNEDALRQKKEERLRQAREDKIEMEKQLAEYEAELERKRADRLSMQREMAAYRDYLIARKAEERRMEEEMDRITAEYQALGNAKQDKEWAENEARRSKLMAEVFAVREQQIMLKKADIERARTKEQQERHAMDLQVLLQQQAEEQEELDRFKRELASKMDLEMQIRHKAYEREAEKARIQQEDEAARLAEAQYREFVRLEQGRARMALTGTRKNF